MFYDFSSINNFNGSYSAFEKNVLGHTDFVLLVYADWCGHCKQMKGPWTESRNDNKSSAHIVEVSDIVFTHLRSQHGDNQLSMILSGVHGYPFVAQVSKADPDAIVTPYQGSFDQEGFKEFFNDFKGEEPLSLPLPLPPPTSAKEKPKIKKIVKSIPKEKKDKPVVTAKVRAKVVTVVKPKEEKPKVVKPKVEKPKVVKPKAVQPKVVKSKLAPTTSPKKPLKKA